MQGNVPAVMLIVVGGLVERNVLQLLQHVVGCCTTTSSSGGGGGGGAGGGVVTMVMVDYFSKLIRW